MRAEEKGCWRGSERGLEYACRETEMKKKKKTEKIYSLGMHGGGGASSGW